MQQRSNERSIALHKKIANKLRSKPELLEVPKENVEKWKKRKGGLSTAIREWEFILNTYSFEKILSLLESDSEDSIRLRSSSPFTRILSENERKEIFEYYSNKL